jgi:hypothetical protein
LVLFHLLFLIFQISVHTVSSSEKKPVYLPQAYDEAQLEAELGLVSVALIVQKIKAKIYSLLEKLVRFAAHI